MAENQDLLSALREQDLTVYCDFYGVDINLLRDDTSAVKCILEKEKWLDSLIRGYCDMSRLNQEICSEFSGCDCEDLCFE
ncbi:hypothetical protein [Ligilactobacillus sp. Marseille-Q7487]|jgi:hypothetical protein|uniref:hypothetical protein n=1 Tax=Ligilactobacillus sp. Marseille-Q7487 TaxID=3022128 RepID=UPI0024A9839B|nr:hypothetical protein [Ligilactobacillus sp. Marseille-Q7487]